MKYPKFLKEGMTLGIPTPSKGAGSPSKINRYNHAIQAWEERGFHLKCSENLLHCEKARSADAKTRGEEINKMFSDREIDGLICASGGEFLVECLPYVDFKTITKNPKLIAGFSDPTGLLYPITSKYDIATIYGQNFSNLGIEEHHKSHMDFLDILCGRKQEVESYPFYASSYPEEVTGIEAINYDTPVIWKTLEGKDIMVEGRIIGGCFDILSELAGTKYDGNQEFHKRYKKDGIIWYFDNCELSMEEVIRTLWKMKELGFFENTKCVIFGRFGTEVSSQGYDVKSCLEDSVLKELNIPVIYDADISHKAPSMPIINGAYAEVTCISGKGKIKFNLK